MPKKVYKTKGAAKDSRRKGGSIYKVKGGYSISYPKKGRRRRKKRR